MKGILLISRCILTLLLSLSLASAAAFGEGKEDCTTALTQNVGEVSARSAEKELRKKGFNKQTAKGYSILIGAMVASAATTTYLTSALPPDFSFLSQLLAQVSTLGVYVFGAPIWEPLSSGFRKIAFGVQGQKSSAELASPTLSELENIWRQTQENFSLNAQMSRNTVTQFIISVQLNFYEAHRAMRSQNPEYAADQIAEAAYRLKVLFKDIPPDEPSVANVVRTAFTNHIDVDAVFVERILRRLSALDQAFATPESQSHYQKMLKAWVL